SVDWITGRSNNEQLSLFDMGMPDDKLRNLLKESESLAPDWATAKDRRDLKKFLESPEVLYFDGIEFTEEDRAKMLGMMEALFWDARQKNKEAYRKSREKKN